jgi:hypothetical protein
MLAGLLTREVSMNTGMWRCGRSVRVGAVLVGITMAAGSLGGCASEQKAGGSGKTARVAGVAGPAQTQMFDKIKSLAGEWTMPGEDGKPMTAATFTVTSNGSVVREIMFPGQSHEMTNVYHLDGSSLVVTHYCAAGNQPRMRARSMDADGSINFTFDSVTNLKTPTTEYMGGLKVIFKDPSHVTQVWTSIVNGKDETSHATFELTRKGG